VIYHESYLRFDLAKGRAHVAAAGGRLKLPFGCDPADYPLLETWRGECELVLREDGFHLLVPCDADAGPAPPFRYTAPGRMRPTS
jgi:hypothetical protein